MVCLERLTGSFHFWLQAISNAFDEQLQELAWKAVVPLVGKLKMFYEYGLEVGECSRHKFSP